MMSGGTPATALATPRGASLDTAGGSNRNPRGVVGELMIRIAHPAQPWIDHGSFVFSCSSLCISL